jgi:hypothetical protein
MAENLDGMSDERSIPGWIAGAIAILAIVAVAGLGFAWYDSSQLATARQTFTTQMKAAQQDVVQQLILMFFNHGRFCSDGSPHMLQMCLECSVRRIVRST